MAGNSQQEPDLPQEFDLPQVPPYTGTLVKWGAVVIGLILLFALLSFLKGIYTDLLWFGSLDLRSVYVKVLVTRVVLFILGAAVVAVGLVVSLYFANRQSEGPPVVPVSPEAVVFLRRLVFWGSLVVVVILSAVFGAIMASHWEIFLRFANSVPFGETDPVFERDISFYVFKLPVYQFLQGWFLGAFIIMMLASLALNFVNFSVRGLRFEVTPGLKVQASIIGAVILFIFAWGHWLDRWDLLLSENGVVFGATYADLNARKPALVILTIIAAASGILMLVNAYTRGLRLLVGAAALWIVMALGLGAAWPALMQRFTVGPNEFAKEAPYILRNIEFTRRGFGLGQVEEVFFPVDPSGVTAELISANPETINNIRLWDPRPLSSVYRQLQLIRPYYDFGEADVDRYTINGEYRQVLLSAREVAPEKLSDEAQTWVNRRLVYTHGIGLAMSPVTEFTSEGRPEFFAKDIPSNGVIPIGLESLPDSPDLVVANPRIYYGENTADYVIVNTKTDELDFQTEEGDLVRTNYFGDGGVRLSSFIKRLAYAWEFGDVNIVISDEITGASRVQYRRSVQERISTVAPFLRLDKDPYIVAAEGRLFWVQDAYTTSDRYPYSAMNVDLLEGSFNYIRNSVKVTVDAFDGTMRFYVWDESDPLILTYRKIFPKLFSSKESMPPGLRAHVRYPQDLFTFQADKYTRYHMRESENFYNDEDLWSFSNEKFGQSAELRVVEPYYVIMKLPGEETAEFVQLIPYTPSQRQNLIGWLAARSDGENYGKLVAFNFPKDRPVDGTEQVEAKIDNDQDISAWFTLRCTEGSTCIRGNLLVIPVGNSIIYAEPIYIQAEGIEFPELKRVILATGERVVMEDSLAEALVALTATGPARAGVEAPAAGVPAGGEPTQTEIDALNDAVEELREVLTSLEEALERLREKEEAGGK
ncbi:MAG: UPF0182 family protein [Chloroflexi bacterium]|nr:UPF0182 family protein [Chloroflexota bacterium]